MEDFFYSPTRKSSLISLFFSSFNFKSPNFSEDETPPEVTQVDDKVEEDFNRISTGCGPSPDREIVEILSEEIPSENSNKIPPPTTTEESNKVLSKVSIGTSPPPQTCGTQVRFDFMLRDENISQHEKLKLEI